MADIKENLNNPVAYFSKSKYCRVWQCVKMEWLHIHHPELATAPSEMQLLMFENGREVGELAKHLFGDDFVDVTTYKYTDDHLLDYSAMVQKTQHEISNGTDVICEASFLYNGLFCSADLLHKTDAGYDIIEVKSATSIKEVNLADIAYQKYIIEKNNIKISGIYVAYVNSEYVLGDELNLKEFFVVEDVASSIEEYMIVFDEKCKDINVILEDENEPDIDLSLGCHEPYPCEFFNYCTRSLEKPNVFNLYNVAFKNKVNQYLMGNYTFEQLPEEIVHGKTYTNAKPGTKAKTLSVTAKVRDLQIKTNLQNIDTDIIDEEVITSFINNTPYPLYFLDFETYRPLIPQFKGTRPNTQITSQYSLHILEQEGSKLLHKEFLGISGTDCRRDFAEHLCNDIPDKCSVIVYNADFEATRIKELAEIYPDLAEKLNNIISNIKDELVVFRNAGYYNRSMGGSLSIKSVLPALYPGDPELDYHSLKEVHNGTEAMIIFPKIQYMSAEEQEQTKANLLKYCSLDTLAMVKVWVKFQQAIGNNNIIYT